MLTGIYIRMALGYVGKHTSGTFALTYSRANARSTAGESMRACNKYHGMKLASTMLALCGTVCM